MHMNPSGASSPDSCAAQLKRPPEEEVLDQLERMTRIRGVRQRIPAASDRCGSMLPKPVAGRGMPER